MFGLLLGIVLSVCICWFHNMVTLCLDLFLLIVAHVHTSVFLSICTPVSLHMLKCSCAHTLSCLLLLLLLLLLLKYSRSNADIKIVFLDNYSIFILQLKVQDETETYVCRCWTAANNNLKLLRHVFQHYVTTDNNVVTLKCH